MENEATYGKTRHRRPDVTYAQVERAATEILKTGVRPTLENVRNAVGGGSPRTLMSALNRYWRDLGSQIDGKPDTLRRLPAAVADLAEGLWQRALAIAVEAAQASSTDAEGRLSRLKSELEVRAHTLSHREVELDELLRSRERTLKELEDHLRAALSMLTKRDATIGALQLRLAAAQQETEDYRQRLAKVIQRAVTRQRRIPAGGIAKTKKAARPANRSVPKKRARKRSATRR